MTDGRTPLAALRGGRDDGDGQEAREVRPGDAPGVRVSLAFDAPGVPGPVVLEGRDGGVLIDGAPTDATMVRFDAERAMLHEGPGGRSHRVLLLPGEARGAGIAPGVERWEVVIDGWRVEVDVEPAARAALRERARRGRAETGSSGPTKVHAIIPGVVVSVSVAPGDVVTAGQQLLVVEAMKMQNELRAPRDGRIELVAIGAGATIELGDLLLVIA